MLQHRGHDPVVGVCGIAVPVDPYERERGWQSLRPRPNECRARIGVAVAAGISDDPAAAAGTEQEAGQGVLAAVIGQPGWRRFHRLRTTWTGVLRRSVRARALLGRLNGIGGLDTDLADRYAPRAKEARSPADRLPDAGQRVGATRTPAGAPCRC